MGRPDLVEPRLTEGLARAQHASAHRLAAELPDTTAVLPTHGFGSFCSAGQGGGTATTIGRERADNPALTRDVDTLVAGLLAGLDDIPAYYTYMGPANAAGPAPVDLTPPAAADAEEIAARLAAGEWVVDLRSRVAFAAGHVPGSYNFEAEGQLAAYLAWLIPWGKPVTLLAESAEQLAAAQRELVPRQATFAPSRRPARTLAAPAESPSTSSTRTSGRHAESTHRTQLLEGRTLPAAALVGVGIDRPAAAATGEPKGWVREGEVPGSFPRAVFADLADLSGRRGREGVVVLDVRRGVERALGFVEGSVHIPLHTVRRRLGEIPPGEVWVHCAGGMRAAVAASLLDAAGRTVVAVDDAYANAGKAGLRLRGARG
ncbi:hypothetical protein OHB41_39735 [Streptomyces sp. NBC_01571]|uniref:rhodanese-like domain-containing protein n=1 Tax=Streptomyces sp. NBC_01571 TaxID=2975883 RepID=UPI00225834C2|nr:rhodanese-like domain-containing protein [Streptomyces sp. NBC_01571]MCX4579208.1 hypothetical protein [Streptomyces sp. NBC_01571]